MANVITTLLKLDGNQFKTGLKSAQQSIAETDGVVNKAKAGWAGMWESFKSSPIAVGAATTAVTAFAAQSIAAASDLNESINAVNVTFGESADKILAFGDNAAKSVGLAKSEFNELATPLGSILKNAGFQLDDVADKTIVLTQRAADMASVFNTDVSDALGAIQAGLRGEQDPLEKYGVGLSAAKVEARALADTGKDTAKALTDQEKQLARVEIILDQTNQTAGDFKNTSDDVANQTRILEAEFKNLEAAAGQDLIPKLSALAAILIEAKDAGDQLGEALRKIPGADGGGGGALGFLDIAQGSFDPIKGLENFKISVDELKKELGGGGGESLADVADRGRDGLAHVAESSTAAGTAAGDAADEVADLGDKAANSGPKIGDMAGALDDAAQHLADLNQEARDEALSRLANAVQGVTDAVDKAFSTFEDKLDIQDLLDNITEQFGKVADAQSKMTEDGDKGVRNYNRSVRDLRRMIRDLLEDIKGIPPDKKVQILTEIERGSIDDLYRILGDLTKGITVPVTFTKTAGFSGANVDFNLGAGTIAPVINNPTSPSTPVPVQLDQRTIINNFPVGTTPTTQYQMGVLDRQRNGERTSL